LSDAPRAAAEVLEFWFGPDPDDPATPKRQAALWWGKVPALDEQIRVRFAPLRVRAIAGELGDWLATPRGRLAAIILVDQFSRNLFRGDPESFRHDPLARRWCREGLDAGHDRVLRPVERQFLYLPLQHSEDPRDQERSVALYAALVAAVPPEARAQYRDYLRFAQRHREIIERFGRFPHRNGILGRESTPAEAAFLREPGSSF
jgi:uncharacterized protein (DUF924 family)